jgi:hypothetical protein
VRTMREGWQLTVSAGGCPSYPAGERRAQGVNLNPVRTSHKITATSIYDGTVLGIRTPSGGRPARRFILVRLLFIFLHLRNPTDLDPRVLPRRATTVLHSHVHCLYSIQSGAHTAAAVPYSTGYSTGVKLIQMVVDR